MIYSQASGITSAWRIPECGTVLVLIRQSVNPLSFCLGFWTLWRCLGFSHTCLPDVSVQSTKFLQGSCWLVTCGSTYLSSSILAHLGKRQNQPPGGSNCRTTGLCLAHVPCYGITSCTRVTLKSVRCRSHCYGHFLIIILVLLCKCISAYSTMLLCYRVDLVKLGVSQQSSLASKTHLELDASRFAGGELCFWQNRDDACSFHFGRLGYPSPVARTFGTAAGIRNKESEVGLVDIVL